LPNIIVKLNETLQNVINLRTKNCKALKTMQPAHKSKQQSTKNSPQNKPKRESIQQKQTRPPTTLTQAAKQTKTRKKTDRTNSKQQHHNANRHN
jgi:hypothetical protein